MGKFSREAHTLLLMIVFLVVDVEVPSGEVDGLRLGYCEGGEAVSVMAAGTR